MGLKKKGDRVVRLLNLYANRNVVMDDPDERAERMKCSGRSPIYDSAPPPGVSGDTRIDPERTRLLADIEAALHALVDADLKASGAIYVRYLAPEKLESKDAAIALGCSRMTYFRRIDRGLEFLDARLYPNKETAEEWGSLPGFSLAAQF